MRATRWLVSAAIALGVVGWASVSVAACGSGPTPLRVLQDRRACTESTIGAVEELVIAHLDRCPEDPEADEMLWELSRAQSRLEHPQAALATLDRIAREHPEQAGRAHLASAAMHLARGDSEQWIVELQRAVRAAPARASGDEAYAWRGAVVRLGLALEQRRRWQEARGMWLACGKGVAELREERVLGVARCDARLGRLEEALQGAWSVVSGQSGLRDSEGYAGELYLWMCQDAGRLGEAEARIRSLPDSPYKRALNDKLVFWWCQQ